MREHFPQQPASPPAPMPRASPRRMRLEAQGTVQGVGFRPYVHRLAGEYGLGGWVLNGPAGVIIEIEGAPEDCAAFLRRFPHELPPRARLASLDLRDAPPRGETAFRIADSLPDARRFTLVPPDIATCPECLRELRDPADRRHGYAFINCTQCGPRFTLILDLPYDRANTTMDAFAMCPACRAEYEDAANRRFHAEPVACPVCGPVLALHDADGRPLPGDPVAGAADLVAAGRIVAVKGLGGFHLACDAADNEAVARLRARKAREEKPLAVMVPDVAAARALCAVSEAEAALLESPARPIVLLEQCAESGPRIAPAVAPGLRELGVMLPYAPLHHVLLDACKRPLVMTSGNLSEEPIAYRNDEATARLGGIADAFLLHEREIHMRCDDSVARVWKGAPRLLRRSRGYAPDPVTVPWPFPFHVLATGGELKNTFCLGRGRFAFLSHHIGDLENEATLRSFESAVQHYERLFQARPEVIVHDLHPDYLTTRYAAGRAGECRVLGVQHHHAHIVAVMAEHGLEGPVIGLAWDGTGYGTDGCLWGGEFLVCGLGQFRRAGHWAYFPLPGGASAIRQPWRTAAAMLSARHGEDAARLPLALMRRYGGSLPVLARMVERKLNSPLSSGVGRLFDAASALLAGRFEAAYEGQAAIALEHLADPAERGCLPVPVEHGEGLWLPDSTALIVAAADQILAGVPAPVVAARFHGALANVAVEVCRAIREETAIREVVLGGGVFQNRLLLDRCQAELSAAGFNVHVPAQVPANDGGLALGQAIIGGRTACA